MTDSLNTQSYGELALGMTIATLVNQLAFGPLSGAVLRFFAPALESRQLSKYLDGAGLIVFVVCALTLGVAALSIVGLLIFDLSRWIGFCIGIAFFAIVTGINNILDGMQNAARQRPVVAIHQGFGMWMRFLLAVGLIQIYGISSTIAIWGYVAAALIVMLSRFFFFRKRILSLRGALIDSQPTKEKNWARQMLSYAIPMSSYGIFTWAQQSSDRWVLAFWLDTSTVGLFAVLYQLGYYPLQLISEFTTQLISPILFSRAGDGLDRARMSTTIKLNNLVISGAIVFSLFASIIAFFYHEQLFRFLAAPEYRQVSVFLPLTVIASGLFAAGQIGALSILISTNTKLLIAPKIGISISGIILNIIFVYFWGIAGVVMAGLVVSFVYLVWILWLINTTSRSRQSHNENISVASGSLES